MWYCLGCKGQTELDKRGCCQYCGYPISPSFIEFSTETWEKRRRKTPYSLYNFLYALTQLRWYLKNATIGVWFTVFFR